MSDFIWDHLTFRKLRRYSLSCSPFSLKIAVWIAHEGHIWNNKTETPSCIERKCTKTFYSFFKKITERKALFSFDWHIYCAQLDLFGEASSSSLRTWFLIFFPIDYAMLWIMKMYSPLGGNWPHCKVCSTEDYTLEWMSNFTYKKPNWERAEMLLGSGKAK